MHYDKQYYMLVEANGSGDFMMGGAEDTDEGLFHLLAMRSLKKEVLGPGKVEVLHGNKRRFTPCDYHSAFGMLVSEKFKQVIDGFNAPKVDFYQADIRNLGQTWSDHYFMHVWNNHRVMHHGRSKIDGTYENDDFTLESFSLDENLMGKIPLEERLIFRLSEKPKFLFHETVMEALDKANLTGLGFEKVTGFDLRALMGL